MTINVGDIILTPEGKEITIESIEDNVVYGTYLCKNTNKVKPTRLGYIKRCNLAVSVGHYKIIGRRHNLIKEKGIIFPFLDL